MIVVFALFLSDWRVSRCAVEADLIGAFLCAHLHFDLYLFTASVTLSAFCFSIACTHLYIVNVLEPLLLKWSHIKRGLHLWRKDVPHCFAFKYRSRTDDDQREEGGS